MDEAVRGRPHEVLGAPSEQLNAEGTNLGPNSSVSFEKDFTAPCKQMLSLAPSLPPLLNATAQPPAPVQVAPAPAPIGPVSPAGPTTPQVQKTLRVLTPNGGEIYEVNGEARHHWAWITAWEPPRRLAVEWKVDGEATA